MLGRFEGAPMTEHHWSHALRAHLNAMILVTCLLDVRHALQAAAAFMNESASAYQVRWLGEPVSQDGLLRNAFRLMIQDLSARLP